MFRPHIYRGTRFERTLDAAFRTPRYASAVERPPPKPRSSIWFVVLAMLALLALGVVK